MVAKLLSYHQTPATVIDELWHLVEDAWVAVLVHAIYSLYDSISRRIAAGGDCSRY